MGVRKLGWPIPLVMSKLPELKVPRNCQLPPENERVAFKPVWMTHCSSLFVHVVIAKPLHTFERHAVEYRADTELPPQK
jgi:hypothetical protein